MEKLWAPWRMDLIARPEAQAGCIFCDLPKSKDDAKNLVLGRTARTFAMLNKYPYNNGHLMVIPRSHASDVHALAEDEFGELSSMLRIALRLVGRAYNAQGANLGMNIGRAAGAGIADHVHIHLLPRWSGDTNFMTTVGETRVLPEDLETTYSKLRPEFL